MAVLDEERRRIEPPKARKRGWILMGVGAILLTVALAAWAGLGSGLYRTSLFVTGELVDTAYPLPQGITRELSEDYHPGVRHGALQYELAVRVGDCVCRVSLSVPRTMR